MYYFDAFIDIKIVGDVKTHIDNPYSIYDDMFDYLYYDDDKPFFISYKSPQKRRLGALTVNLLDRVKYDTVRIVSEDRKRNWLEKLFRMKPKKNYRLVKNGEITVVRLMLSNKEIIFVEDSLPDWVIRKENNNV